MSPKKSTIAEEPIEPRKPSRTEIKNRQLRILLFSVVSMAVLAIAAVILYEIYLAPYRKPVLTFDGNVIRMQYFLDRAKLIGNTQSTLQQLAYEQTVKLAAPTLGVTVSESEVDNALHQAAESATSSNETSFDTSTQAGFDAWYKEQLKKSGLSTTQYRDMVRTGLIANQIESAMASNVPAKAEQIHLHIMVFNTQAAADAAKARVDRGESFAAVAKAVSVDAQSKENGGDIGWFPKGVLPYDDTVFALEIGQISSPVLSNPSSPTTSQYLLFLVSEKDPSRDVDPAAKATMVQNAFYYWLQDQMTKHKIEYKLTTDDQAWVQWQLTKTQ